LFGASDRHDPGIAGGSARRDGAAGQAARWLVDGLALLLPRLDALARGDWLLYGARLPRSWCPRWAAWRSTALLASAGLFDFSRESVT
jgi:hypothetical protein